MDRQEYKKKLKRKQAASYRTGIEDIILDMTITTLHDAR